MNAAARHANHMRMQAALAAGKVGKPKAGTVTDYDPAAYSVKVMLQPEGIETGWLPIVTAMAGNGFGVYFGPANGDQAVVSFLEGDREVGWCTGFLPSDVDAPPTVPAGEIHVIHKAGAFVKFLTDGTVSIEADAGILSKGPWTHTGTLHVTDEVTADKSVTASVDVVGGGKHLKTHVHSGVTAGAGNTGQPV
jgi:phage baseplate assembly protein V